MKKNCISPTLYSKKKLEKHSLYCVAFAFQKEPMLSIEDLTTLTPNEKDLLRKHCELSGHMRRIRHLRTFLINEIHDKRAVLKRNKYKINPELETPYGKILFGGKKRVTGFDTFPCSYQGTLDSLVFRDFRNTAIENLLLSADPAICLTRFYYDESFPIKEFQSAAKFDDSEWALNDPSNDLNILHRFRDEFIAYMCHVEDVLARTPRQFQKSQQIHSFRTERRRYARVCGVLEAHNT